MEYLVLCEDPLEAGGAAAHLLCDRRADAEGETKRLADLPRGKHRERHHVLGARAAVRARGAGACVWGSCYGLELGLELGLDDAAHRAA